jgi:uncharacterized protein YkwD
MVIRTNMEANLCRQVFDELNSCRRNPSQYSSKVKRLLPLFKGDVMHKPGETPIQTTEGKRVVQECVQYLDRARPVPALTWSDALSRASQDHCNDCGPAGHFGHDGANGSTMEERVERYVEWEGSIGENIDYGNKVAEDIVVSLLVDDGTPERGHRLNIMNSEYKIVGVGFGNHSETNYMCTIDFASAVKEKAGSRQSPAKQPSIQPSAAQPEAPKRLETPTPRQSVTLPSILDGASELPADAVKMSTRIVIKNENGRKIRRISRTIEGKDGSVETIEEVEEVS